MTAAKLHHYVPQFHLRRFADAAGKLWVWDRERDRMFTATPNGVAAETYFYRLTQYEVLGRDPMEMEKQLSALEGEVAPITAQWLDWLREMAPLDTVEIPMANRGIFSHFLAIQYLRTADTRDILAALLELDEGRPRSPEERRLLHTELMWNEALVNDLAERFNRSIWVFARNSTGLPFFTSDNPIAFRTSDNRRWLRTGILGSDVYAVFPMAPDIVLYCYPNSSSWDVLTNFADRLSPVVFDAGMVESENSGQVFMASRFIFSTGDDFDAARAFASTIGTEAYAPKSP